MQLPNIADVEPHKPSFAPAVDVRLPSKVPRLQPSTGGAVDASVGGHVK